MATPDDTCDALARRIAELDPNWAKPGMACRLPLVPLDEHDPADCADFVWRRAGEKWVGEWDAGWAYLARQADDQWSKQNALAMAIANGPDWHDDATLGALLIGLPVQRPLFAESRTVTYPNGARSASIQWWHDYHVGGTAAQVILQTIVELLENEVARAAGRDK